MADTSDHDEQERLAVEKSLPSRGLRNLTANQQRP